jgi:hypothetical protein
MTTIKATFDGSVFMPQEPVDLPVGYELEMALERLPNWSQTSNATFSHPSFRGAL